MRSSAEAAWQHSKISAPSHLALNIAQNIQLVPISFNFCPLCHLQWNRPPTARFFQKNMQFVKLNMLIGPLLDILEILIHILCLATSNSLGTKAIEYQLFWTLLVFQYHPWKYARTIMTCRTIQKTVQEEHVLSRHYYDCKLVSS